MEEFLITILMCGIILGLILFFHYIALWRKDIQRDSLEEKEELDKDIEESIREAFRKDYLALRRDWEKIGADFRRAQDKYRKGMHYE